jgi:ribonuclease/clavin/mitogillin
VNDDEQLIIDGIRVVPVRTPTLPPATHTNVWILGDHHVTVIDPASPYPDEQDRLDTILEMYMVEKIVLTHHHADHVGGAEDLRKRTGARIAAHPLTAERVGFTVDELLEDGDVFGTDAGVWRAIHTPGHATGHLCFYNAGMGLVAGDMVAGIGTILLDPPEGNLALYLDSLSMLRDLKPERLLPAHGPHIEDAVGCLSHYIHHRHQRTEQITRALADSGPASAEDLVAAVYRDAIPKAFYPIAARQVLCHLQWLDTMGTVRCDDGVYMLRTDT